MRANSLVVALLTCALGVSGCSAPAASVPQPFASASVSTVPSGTADADAPASPPGIDLDTAKAVPLPVGAEGGTATITAGTWRAMVVVPGGSAGAGATWTVTPMGTIPAGRADALSAGFSVDEAGQPPTGDCLIGFAAPGKADPDATIVRLSADGASSELVATYRRDLKKTTLLMAQVSGFSSYGVGKAAKPARDAARKKAQQKKGTYVISVHDKVGFTKQDWHYTYTLDLNLAGGGTGSAGSYKGTASLLFTGEYTETLGGVLAGLGKLRWQGKGSGEAYLLGELGALADLKNGLPYQMDDINGSGTATFKGSGGIKATVKAPIGTMNAGYETKDGVAIPYLIHLDGEKVTVEIANVGEFSGHLVKF